MVRHRSASRGAEPILPPMTTLLCCYTECSFRGMPPPGPEMLPFGRTALSHGRSQPACRHHHLLECYPSRPRRGPRNRTGLDVSRELLAYISPLGWAPSAQRKLQLRKGRRRGRPRPDATMGRRSFLNRPFSQRRRHRANWRVRPHCDLDRQGLPHCKKYSSN